MGALFGGGRYCDLHFDIGRQCTSITCRHTSFGLFVPKGFVSSTRYLDGLTLGCLDGWPCFGHHPKLPPHQQRAIPNQTISNTPHTINVLSCLDDSPAKGLHVVPQIASQCKGHNLKNFPSLQNASRILVATQRRRKSSFFSNEVCFF
jgi:hypothetical protein